MLYRLPRLVLFLLLMLCIACGGGGGGAVSSGDGGPTAPGSGLVPAATATVRLESVLAKTVPAEVTSYRLTGYDLGGGVRFGPQTKPKAALVEYTGVSVSVRRIQVEYLAGQRVLGLALVDVVLEPGQVAVFADLDFQEVEARLTALTIEPASLSLASGTSGKLDAIGHYDDGSVLDLSGSVTWAVNGDNVDIEGQGRVQALAPGNAQIGATFGGLSASGNVLVGEAELVSISLDIGSPSLPLGTSRQLAVRGTFSDDRQQDLSEEAIFTSSHPTRASLSGRTVNAVAPGSATITARVGDQSVSAELTVTAAVLQSLQISPSPLTLPKGTSRQLTASGTFSDGDQADLTEMVTWTSSAPDVVDVTPEGLLRGLKEGSATVSARRGQSEARINASVSPAVVTGLTLEPSSLSVTVGQQRQLNLSANLSDGTTRDITSDATFRSAAPDIAGVSTLTNRGLVTAVAPGRATITAEFESHQAQATVEVLAIPVGDLAVTLQLVQARAVDGVVATYRLNLLSPPLPGAEVLEGPRTFARASSGSQQTLSWTGIPAGDYVLQMEMLDSEQTLRGTFRQRITIRAGEVTTVEDPQWEDSPLSPPPADVPTDPKQIVQVPLNGTPRALAFDSTRNRVYISNSTQGTVEVYDAASKSLLSSITVGSAPWGLDLTTDNDKLVVALSGTSTVATVDLTTDPVTMVTANVPATEKNRPRNLAVAANGKAFFGTIYPGSGWTSVYQLDLTTNIMTLRNDLVQDQSVRDPLYLGASRDRSTIVFGEGNSSAGDFFLYDSPTNTFGVRRRTGTFINRAAANADGSQVAVNSGFYNTERQKLASLSGSAVSFCYSTVAGLGSMTMN